MDKELKYVIIQSHKASLDSLDEVNDENSFFSFGGGIPFPIEDRIGFVDFLHYIFTKSNSNDDDDDDEDKSHSYTTFLDKLKKHKADYRDMKIDMFLG